MHRALVDDALRRAAVGARRGAVRLAVVGVVMLAVVMLAVGRGGSRVRRRRA